jgi:EF-P beta-lysylation protein EpmB
VELIAQAMPASDSWQQQLRNAVDTAEELLDALDLLPEDVGYSAAACRQFALKAPMAFVRRMQPGNPRDPLLLQVLASGDELLEVAGYELDPVGETGQVNPHRGVIHKYQGRALLIVSSGCAINCRYCFRRHFPYADNQNSRQQWQDALAYIAADPGINEVILSGGDPLLPSDKYLDDLVTQIANIPQVRRLRIHTRLPVVLPARVTPGLIDAICAPGLQTVMVIHCNHPNEIDAEVEESLAVLAGSGITLLNQSVLLAGINDDADTLCALSERLFTAGVLPYYLHLLDKVRGAAHFDVSEQRAREIMSVVTARLPGYLVPKLVREVAGMEAKQGVPLA